MFYADLSPCNYFGAEAESSLTAIGWLESPEAFPIGVTTDEHFSALKELLTDPFQPGMFGGFHTCSLCQFDGAMGKNNLFIPHEGGIFVCPELILHYIAAHRYCPPEVFWRAVENCPPTRSMDYKRKLLANGGRVLLR